jgi:hypothetical protein
LSIEDGPRATAAESAAPRRACCSVLSIKNLWTSSTHAPPRRKTKPQDQTARLRRCWTGGRLPSSERRACLVSASRAVFESAGDSRQGAGPVNPDVPFHVADGPDVHARALRQGLLSESQPEPGSPGPSWETVPFRDGSNPEDALDRRPAGGQRLREVLLPPGDALVPAAQPLGKGSLRQPSIHPSLADSLSERVRCKRITPWEHTRSRTTDPQVAERQRNGVAVDGSGIRSAVVAARRPRSRSIMRE